MDTHTTEPGERSEFYLLVREITERLVGCRGVEIDKTIDYCLKMIGNYFRVTQVGLGQWSKSGQILPSLRAWGPKPVSDYLVTDGPGVEAFAYLCRNGSIVWNCIEDLDELPQLQEHLRRVRAMAGAFCLNQNFGSHTQHLVMARVESEVWPEDTVECLSAIGGVLFNALYRRRAELEAERMHQFEQVMTKVSAKFVDIIPEAVDEEINTSLRLICKCIDADLGSLLQWDELEKSRLKVSHEWKAESIGGPYLFGEVLANEYPWLASRLKAEEPLVISHLDDFPAAATAERAMCERAGIQSIVWTPCLAPTGFKSYIVLATVNRPGLPLESFTPQVAMVGSVFTNAINRQRTDLQLRRALDEICDLKDHIEAENVVLREETISSGSGELVGMSLVFRHILYQAEQVGPTDSTVLLLGETGTGKGLIAHRVHEYSQRKNHPLITVDCAALPGSLIESELFGHEQGAFTGAVRRKIGRFEVADGGTIFLDEIGDLPIELQSKLLRVLQDRKFERLGSSTTRTVDIRVIAATNRDLDALIEKGAFRADLYYRLGVFPIHLPKLSERRDDIPLLVWYFITKLQSRLGKTFKTVPRQSMDALISYAWPGNVRELRNIVERSMILSPGGTLDLDSSFLETRGSTPTATQTSARQSQNLEEVERTHILSVLESCDWKVRGKGGAAEHLGLNRSTLQSRMKKLGIHRPTA